MRDVPEDLRRLANFLFAEIGKGAIREHGSDHLDDLGLRYEKFVQAINIRGGAIAVRKRIKEPCRQSVEYFLVAH